MSIVIDVINGRKITKAMEKAIVRAVNKAAAKAKTAASKKVRSVYNIKARDLNPLMHLIRGRIGSARAGFLVESRYGLKLLYFQAKDIDPKGVRVKVKKTTGAKVLHHAFIAKMPSGHVNVFERTGKFTTAQRGRYKGKRRETIRSLYSVDPVVMFEKQATETVQQTLEIEFYRLFEKQLDYELGKIA